MKTILLPTDFSENAANAIDYAINMYGDEEARFILMNAYNTPHAGASMLVSIEDIMHKEAVNDLKMERQRIIDEHVGHVLDIDTRAVFGDVMIGLNTVCNEVDVDMIVMGTKGATGLKGAILGSNTAAVIKKARRPLIIVPEQCKFEKPVNITFACDMELMENTEDLGVIKRIARKYGSTIGILKVHTEVAVMADDGHEATEMLKEQFTDLNFEFIDTVKPDIIGGIESYVEDHDVDLLALVSREHSFIDRILNKSVSKQLVMHADLPVLILHENR